MKMDFHNLFPQEWLLVEHVLSLNREVRTACQDAPYGHLLDADEQAAVALLYTIPINGKITGKTNLPKILLHPLTIDNPVTCTPVANVVHPL